jgi:hypothetical protein
MGLKGVSDKRMEKPKRSVLITQDADDKFTVVFEGVTAKHNLQPLLRAAEKELHVKLARHEI